MMPALPPLRSRLRPALGLFAGILLNAACASGDLSVGAAVSLRDPVERIASQYEAATGERIRLAFGASSALAAQIRAGAPLDLLLSADAQITDALFAEGEVEAPQPLATNRLVVVTREGLAFAIDAPEDLARAPLRRIAIPARSVPVGRYVRAWLERRSLFDALRGRIVQTEHARATLAAVDQGNADAAIVYRTDARLARHARVAFEIAADEHPAIRYTAAIVARGEAIAARSFLAQLTSAAGREALADAGFGLPADSP